MICMNEKYEEPVFDVCKKGKLKKKTSLSIADQQNKKKIV